MHITSKGIVLFSDAMVSMFFITAIAVLASWQILQSGQLEAESIKAIELENKAVFLADSIIKNHDTNILLGIAVMDEEKHRTKSNEIEEEKIPGLENNPMIFEVWTRKENQKNVFFSKQAGEKKCIAVERVVLIEKEKAVIGVKACE